MAALLVTVTPRDPPIHSVTLSTANACVRNTSRVVPVVNVQMAITNLVGHVNYVDVQSSELKMPQPATEELDSVDVKFM